MAKRVLKTTEEVAEILSVSAITVQRMAANNEIPARKVAGRWRFDSGELDVWLKKSATGIDDELEEGQSDSGGEHSSEVISELRRVGDSLNDINKSIRQVGKAMQKRRTKNGSRNQ